MTERKDNSQNKDLLASDLILYSDSVQMAADQLLTTRRYTEISSATVPIPLSILPLNTPLPCTFYLKWQGKLIVFRRQSEKITTRRALDLEKKGYNTLYIHNSFWNLFLNHLENSIDETVTTLSEKADTFRSLLVAYGMELERRSKTNKKPIFDKMQSISSNLAYAIASDTSVAKTLLKRSTDSLLYFANHSVNVAIYSTLIAKKMGFESADLKLLFYSALVHDVGDLYVPKEILFKQGALNSQELEIVQGHARRGAELLISISSPGPVVQTALQHHERVDGKGYPSAVPIKMINPFARIVTIADVYDALTNNRPYEKGFAPEEAIKKMVSLQGKFDASILTNVV